MRVDENKELTFISLLLGLKYSCNALSVRLAKFAGESNIELYIQVASERGVQGVTALDMLHHTLILKQYHCLRSNHLINR